MCILSDLQCPQDKQGSSQPVLSIKLILIFIQIEKLPTHQIMNMPALSPTMTQGSIGAWKKKEGESISPGDVLCEIETDKATMDFECQEDGFLAKILAPEGTKDWPVGKPVAVLVDDKSAVAAFKNFKIETEQREVPTAPVEVKDASGPMNVKKSQPALSQSSSAFLNQLAHSGPSRVIASPVAKYLAKDHGIDLSQIAGSGPNHRILKHDVLDAISKPQGSSSMTTSASFSGQAYVDFPLSNIRKVIAQRLSESKQTIPHYYLTSDIDMTRALSVRKQINETAKGEFKVSVNDIIVKASSLAMMQVPEVNSSWQDTFIRQWNKVDISVAVATEIGLITPIVTDANLKGLQEISKNIRELADLAKKGKLRPEQFQGGTFTISNLGMFGSVSSFTAIINPPQSCILAVGSTQSRLMLEAGGSIKEAQVMQVTLSCDHRAVDGATGARWLSWLKKYLEEPALMLL